MEIAQATRGLATAWQPGSSTVVNVGPPMMVAAARRISTSIRKLLLEGNRSLLKQCVVEPSIHPMKAPHGSGVMRFLRHFEEQRFAVVFENGITSDVKVPAFDHTTAIDELYGVRHLEGTKFELYNPFDHDADPIRFQRWMNLRILEIDGHQFTAEQILRDMSNKEGAHIEDNPALIVPADLNIDRDKNTLHRLANGVRFGSMTYLQMFSFYTGLYIVNRTRPMLQKLPFPTGIQAVADICEVIANSPRSMAANGAEVQLNSNPMAVLGHDGHLRGDYGPGIESTFRIPK